MFEAVNNFLQHVDDLVWGVPLIVAILLTGIYLTIRLKGIQITKLPKALKYMFENEESGHGEVTSFGALVLHFPQPSVPEISLVWQPRS